ncbi:uncharacterized protein SRS1_15042 [Sporisorium reilianum f. sp. reilianum]|uniref:DUF4604 domain-containing protein n=1 Tax=Sporisorium reilianum f. sp. reilianum TaxID=72559 RepID=A0A2N8UHT2_9BASI|nr:uncharacterized protein SRS1_15042 [Sporisorium reilianum f. sp. reilianum]
MSARKPSLASRSLQYHAPEPPAFLQKLQAQVAASERYASASTRDELDVLVASSSSSKRKVDDDGEGEGGEGVDSDDEMHGAQVVVLSAGKHVSHDEALRIKTHDRERGEKKAQNIADPATRRTKKKRLPIASPDDKAPQTADPKSSALDDVKLLIRQQRTPSKPAKKPRKTKPGSGLSFTFDDD